MKKLFIISLLFVLCSCEKTSNELDIFINNFKGKYGNDFTFENGTYFYQSSQLNKCFFKDSAEDEVFFKEEVNAVVNLTFLPNDKNGMVTNNVNWINYQRKTYKKYYSNYTNCYEEYKIKSKNNKTTIQGKLVEDKESFSIKALLNNCSVSTLAMPIKNILGAELNNYLKDTSQHIDGEEKNYFEISIYFHNNVLCRKSFHYQSNVLFNNTSINYCCFEFDDDLVPFKYSEFVKMINCDNDSEQIYYVDNYINLYKVNDDVAFSLDTALPKATYINNEFICEDEFLHYLANIEFF